MTTAIAMTILAQLGGNRFTAMTGAKQFGDTGNGLSFRLPSNFATKGINHVKIELNDLDLYDITFTKIRGMKVTVIAEASGIYCDMLRDVFTKATGLDTSL